MTDDQTILNIYNRIPEDGSPITYSDLLKKTGACKETLSRSLEYLQETVLIVRTNEKGRGRYGKVTYARNRLDNFLPFSYKKFLDYCQQIQKKTEKTHPEGFKFMQAACILSALSRIDLTILCWMSDYVKYNKKTLAKKILKGHINTVLKPMVIQLTSLLEQGLDESVINLVGDNLPPGFPDVTKIKVIIPPKEPEKW